MELAHLDMVEIKMELTKVATDGTAGRLKGTVYKVLIFEYSLLGVVLPILTRRFVQKSSTCKVLMQIPLDGLLFLWFRRVL